MVENQRQLDFNKKKGFSLDLALLKKGGVLLNYVICDILFLYESLHFDKMEKDKN